MELYLLVILLMSFITFILYAVDKRKAIKKKWRIPEKVLLLASFFFGSIGGICGMYLLRHKNRHWYFVVVNLLSLTIHLILGWVVYQKIGFIFI